MKPGIFLIFLFCFYSGFAVPLDEGKRIFILRCGNCHKVDKAFIGPALAGVDERRKFEWIVNFVKSSQTMVKSGDKDAVELFEKFNKLPMPDHTDLSNESIKSVVEYIAAESKKAPTAESNIVQRRIAKYTMLTAHSYKFFTSYFVAIALLIIALLFAVRVKEFDRHNKTVG